ncbi:hypothetical protein [Burkholderia ambifaria]|uniref:hypothetical protein n=1 Tax=Burkholderia ambifaria TaxID=152480 RepID=UPI00158E86B3|nr:hypothetical protein [Burkholderia ambifaria]
MNLYKINEAAAAIARAIAPDDSADQRKAIAEQWQRELMVGFRDGALRVLDVDNRIHIPPGRPGAVVGAVHVGAVTREELNRWLSAEGIPVTVDEKHFAEAPAPVSAGGATDGPKPGLHWNRDPYWKKVGREHANQIARRNMEQGYGGTSHRDIEVDVTAALVREPGFPNPTVKPGRIRKVILKGWKWDGVVVAPTARSG